MIDVIFPVLDEAQALPWVLVRLPDGYRSIVVDNGSVDGSAAIARQLGATVVDEPERGFGAACWRGLTAADADVVIFCDADASLDPTEFPVVAQPVQAGVADLVLGRRCPTTRGAWPLHARLANRWLAARVSRIVDVPLRDIGPMRAVRRDWLLTLGMRDRRYGWPLEMVLRAGAAGWRITEANVSYYPRRGRSKVTGTVRGTTRAVHDMRKVLAQADAKR